MLCRLNGVIQKLRAEGSICSLPKCGSSLDCSAMLLDANDIKGGSLNPALMAEGELGGEECCLLYGCPEQSPLKKRSQGCLGNLCEKQDGY